MRKLGEELGASAMSAYYYFPNKERLLDGMVDVVFGEIEPPSPELDWKTAMRRRAVSTREALNRHRWAIGHMEGRTDHGPANLRLHAAVLGCLRAAGFSLQATVHADVRSRTRLDEQVRPALIDEVVQKVGQLGHGSSGRRAVRGRPARLSVGGVPVDLVVADVSFISLKLALAPALDLAEPCA